MSGNVHAILSDTILGEDEPHSNAPGRTWQEFPDITNWGTLSQQAVGPSNPAWNSAQAIGQIISENSATDTRAFDVIRGTSFEDNSYYGDGLELLWLEYVHNAPDLHQGFRCAK